MPLLRHIEAWVNSKNILNTTLIMLRYSCILCFLFLSTGICLGQIDVSEDFNHELGPGLAIPNNSATFTGSMNNYIAAQENILSHKDYQYISFYNDERKVVVARRNLCGGAWEFAILADYIQSLNDRHNHISMGICYGDGTIHLAFDHHAHDLNYRVSVAGLATHPEEFVWADSLFGPVKDNLVDGVKETRVTYPVFFASKDGHLNMAYRQGGSGNGESRIAFYNGKTQMWEDVHTFVDQSGAYQDPYLSNSSTSRNPYHFDYVYDSNNILHASWVWREGSQSGYNHDIAYAWSPDHGFTWYNNDTVKIGESSADTTFFIKYSSPGLHVFVLDSRYGMINNGGQTVDHLNQPHLIARHRIQPVELETPKYANSSDGSYFHYWRDTTGTWHQQRIPFFASRTKIYSDAYGNLYLPYGSNRLRLLVAEAANNWANWTQIFQALPTTQRNEHHADRNRLMQHGILSVVSHEFDGTITDGPMHVTDLKFNFNHLSKIQIDLEADAYVRGDTFSTTNFGNAETLIVKDNNNSAFDRKIYLRFDLSKLSASAVFNIQKAELVMDVKVGQNSFAVETYDLFKLDDDSWEEDSITWVNAPENSAILQTIPGDSAQMRWDLTQEVISEWNADGKLSLSLANSFEGGNSIIHFFSKEAPANGLAPRLLISADSSCNQDISAGYWPTDIEDEDVISPVKLFPNPTRGIIHLEWHQNHGQEMNWVMTDIRGKVLLTSGSNISSTTPPQKININHLPSGLYFFSLKSKKGSVYAQKIIKQ